MTDIRFPPAPRDAVIGLLGGSFDPPHQGHVHITKAAIRAFDLDRVWWLVSPGNPLKLRGPANLAERMQAARAIMRHPRVTVTDIEAQIGTRYTAETLARLKQQYRTVRFVWLMGADNLAQFHRWQEWRAIMAMVPVGVLARPGSQVSARLSRAARIFAGDQINARDARLLARMAPPAWCFVNLPLNEQSSSAIRARGEWS